MHGLLLAACSASLFATSGGLQLSEGDAPLGPDSVDHASKDVILPRYTKKNFTHVKAPPKGQLGTPTVDVDQIQELAHKNVFFYGSSLDRHTVIDACKLAGREAAYVQNSTDGFECDLGEFKMACLHNLGTGEPPYWTPPESSVTRRRRSERIYFAYDRSEQNTKVQGPWFTKKVFGSDPTLVVVDSSLWDLAKWWQQSGMPDSSTVSAYNIERWCHRDVPELLSWVSAAFPNSRVVFRTPPKVKHAQSGRSPEAMDAMSACISSALRGKYDLIDYHGIVDDMLSHGMFNKENAFRDPTHPSMDAAMLYLNEVLNYLDGL